MEELITLRNVLWQRLEGTMMISRVKVTIIISDDDNINDAKASKQWCGISTILGFDYKKNIDEHSTLASQSIFTLAWCLPCPCFAASSVFFQAGDY